MMQLNGVIASSGWGSLVYVPAHYRMQDEQVLLECIRAWPFATLVTSGADEVGPAATHLPLVLSADAQRLYGHVARSNPQWRHMDGARVLAIFHGPHAYISPSWYVEQDEVPTWDYVAVHVYGRAKIATGSDRVREILLDLMRHEEPDSPLVERMTEPLFEAMMRGIVAFEIELEVMEGAAKLSQNKCLDTRRNIATQLRARSDDNAHGIANLIDHLENGKR